jgi:GT2 family glycosyltransferase
VVQADHRLSVVVVNFNGREHLKECLPALEVQTRPPDQVVVVDNGSTDGSCDYVRQCHPRTTLVELSGNAGFTGGNIAGLGAATGDYIVLLNNDTRPFPDWLERLVECADRHAEVGLIASHMTDWEGTATDTAGDGCTVTGRGIKLRGRPGEGPPHSGYVFSVCAGAALYKRAMLDEVGFLEPSFFMNAEDTDLAFRAQLAGWKAYFCARAEVRHRIGASQGMHSPDHVFFSTRNHVWFYVRCMPTRLVVKHGIATLLQGLFYLAYFAKRGLARPYLRGLVAAARGLPAALRSRRLIQRSRRVPVSVIEAQLMPFTEFLARKFRESA